MANKSASSLRTLKSFGYVAAEDDAVLDYFLSTDAVSKIENNEVFLVLGRKGAGKTAIVRHFTEGNTRTQSKALNLRGYPWSLHSTRIDRGVSDMEAYVSSWRYLIALQLASLVSNDTQRPQFTKVVSLRRFLSDNYGAPTPDLSTILRPKTLRISKLSIQPQFLGCKLAEVALERSPNDLNFGPELDAITSSLLETCRDIIKNESLGPYILHFDELDQGLSLLDETRRKLIIGLILAARDVRLESFRAQSPINPVIYLRSDLWDDLEFSDKNKISQTQALRLEWSDSTLLRLVNTRLEAKLKHGATLESVTDNDKLMRGSQSKWNHILSRTFLRPRDVIQFLNSALDYAKHRSDEPLRFSNRDIINSRQTYSAYLKEELDDEILPHWPKWEQALQACSAISTITFTRDSFRREYDIRRSDDNDADAESALERLYRFSVIGYSTRSGYGGSSWTFQYTDPQAGWDNAATQFKVHLGLKEYAKLREERQT